MWEEGSRSAVPQSVLRRLLSPQREKTNLKLNLSLLWDVLPKEGSAVRGFLAQRELFPSREESPRSILGFILFLPLPSQPVGDLSV